MLQSNQFPTERLRRPICGRLGVFGVAGSRATVRPAVGRTVSWSRTGGGIRAADLSGRPGAVTACLRFPGETERVAVRPFAGVGCAVGAQAIKAAAISSPLG